MKKIIFLIIGIIFIIIIHSGSYEFAKFLFNENDYFRSITELKRIFYSDSIVDTNKIYNLIGVNYMKMQEYDNAIMYFDKIKDNDDNAYNNYFLTLFLKKDFNKIINEKDIKTDKARSIVLLANLFSDNYKKGDITSDNKEVQDIFDNYFLLKRKNVFLAGFLSAILPSAGRFYCERNADGIFSLMTILMPAGLAVYYYLNDMDVAFYISTAFTGLFYIGDIYGAANSAHVYFPTKKKVYYEKIINSNYYSIFSPDYSF